MNKVGRWGNTERNANQANYRVTVTRRDKIRCHVQIIITQVEGLVVLGGDGGGVGGGCGDVNGDADIHRMQIRR